MAERSFNALIGFYRSVPVLFQSQNRFSNMISGLRTEEETFILRNNFCHRKRRCPRTQAPSKFVHIIGHTFRIGDITIGHRFVFIMYSRIIFRLRIDRFSTVSQRESLIPTQHRILAANAMRYIGIMTKQITLGQTTACLKNGRTSRSANNTAQPVRLFYFNIVIEIFHLLIIKSLKRNPHACRRMIFL